jgi:hypothetical protein
MLALTLVLLGGCAGRPANPVMVYQPGDQARSCVVLERELAHIENEILDLMPQTRKAAKNTALGVSSFLLLVPVLFMDISKSEQIEVNALTKRYNHLLAIGESNHCDLRRQRIPDFQKAEF